jgi:hypothetical protein
MINRIRISPRLIMSVMVILLISLGTGCKSKKKAMEAAKAKSDREYMEQQAALAKQKQEEERKQREADELRRQQEEAASKNVEPRQRLDGYLNAIAGSGSVTAANTSINEALSMFASPQTPVLIVISEYAGQKDYDRPTTIIDYLNYLKDQKKNMNKISNVQFDASGKITELELTKQK